MDRFKFRVWCNQFERYMILQETTFRFDASEGIIGGGECCEIEQCTGLKDKNGSLIYCGDIVAPDGIPLWFEYDNDYACYVLTNNDWCKPVSKIACDFEVIGNIHENPELLEA